MSNKIPKEIKDNIDNYYDSCSAAGMKMVAAYYGYSLALEQLEEKQKELDAKAFDIDLFEKEITRLKGLIEEAFFKLGGDRFFTWEQFKTENNL
jgi:hypothetical protein